MSKVIHIFLAISYLSALQFQSTVACKGCITLDEHNLNKIVPRFQAVVAKVDQAYPYGDKHDLYVKFAEENVANTEILFAELPVKDYGEKENFDLAGKYGLDSKKDLPAVLLFKRDVDKPLKMSTELNLENLRMFVRDNTDLYLSLPGCVEAFDRIANQFVSTEKKDEREKLLTDLEIVAKDASYKDQDSVKTYQIYMKKILELGTNFVGNESNRLKKILKDAKLSQNKKDDLALKLNILYSFKPPKDEL